MGYSRRGRNLDGCLHRWRERQMGKNHKQRHWSFLLKAISAAVRGIVLPAQPACAGESSHACPLFPSQTIWGRLPSETGWRGGKIKRREEFGALSLFILRFQNMEGGLVKPNPCRAHSPPGLAPTFLCLPIIPLPTGPNAGLSKGEALATPFWLSSADLFIPVWRKLMHFNMIWGLFCLVKTSFKSCLFTTYEVLSSFALPASFRWPTETTKRVCVFSDGAHGCWGKSDPGCRSFVTVMVCFARLLSQMN